MTIMYNFPYGNCKSNANLSGKVAIVTGGSSGMGLEAAKDLAKRGARVIIASRNATKLQQARDDIRNVSGNSDVDYRLVDFASFRSVRQFTNEIGKEERLDILLNNAGGIAMPDILTEDGLNLTMQVNFFSVFLLTYLLFPLLKSSAPSRIINSSAVTLYFGDIDFDHWNDIGRYDVITASGNAKLAEVLITLEWDRRVRQTGVTANSYDPWFVKQTEIARYQPKSLVQAANLFLDILGRPKKEVGLQMAYYASAPELETVSGVHFMFCKRWPHHWLGQDLELRRRLWEESKRIVKIKPEEDWELNGLLDVKS